MDLATRGGRARAREQLPLAEGFMERDSASQEQQEEQGEQEEEQEEEVHLLKRN